MATRRRSVEGAAEEIRERGAAGATLDGIRARTATSRSRLVHCFSRLPPAVAAREALSSNSRLSRDALHAPPLPRRRGRCPHSPHRAPAQVRYEGRGPALPQPSAGGTPRART
ncbi:hypothetical protein GCM10010345_73850 [Streptomyces canarius]|uniref:HTH tetR-type domain-containing protein n=1 Tax=Streptomyces canarius TaxID=285453 RepID=A0ABQ3D4Q4_9ACTN|nr:hypothetical protein GCM10010345_73850 [Streptomyces canarius]